MEKHDLKINDIEFTIFKDAGVWGDGTHESTKSIMDLICKYGVEGKTVIDIGTGTGILSVLCGRLGASHILAIDLSTHALEYARKNFKQNEVAADVEVDNLTDYIDDKADVILANLPDIAQVENVKTIAKNMHDNGLLIISWRKLLDFNDLVRGFEVIEHIEGEEWDAYVLKKASN